MMVSDLDEHPDVTLATLEQRSHEWIESPAHDGFDALGIWSGVAGLFGISSTAGIAINERNALGYGPVWRGVQLLGGAISKLPLHVFRQLPDGSKERIRDHPAARMFSGLAAPGLPWSCLIHRLIADVILYGNGYAEIGPGGLMRLEPRQVMVPEDPGGLYVLHLREGGVRALFWDELLHLRTLTADGLRGYGLLDLARESLGLGIAARTFGAVYFRNAATPQVAIKSPVKLTPQQRDALRHDFEAVHRGLGGAARTAIIDGGGEIQRLAVDPSEAQLIELRKFELRDVANCLGVPPHYLGDDSRTSLASLESESQNFLDHSLDPWLRTVESECNIKLLGSDSGLVCEYARQALVRADLKSRGQFYSAMLAAGVMTRNEVRLLENLNPLPGLDEPLEPLNMGRGDGGDERSAA